MRIEDLSIMASEAGKTLHERVGPRGVVLIILSAVDQDGPKVVTHVASPDPLSALGALDAGSDLLTDTIRKALHMESVPRR